MCIRDRRLRTCVPIGKMVSYNIRWIKFTPQNAPAVRLSLIHILGVRVRILPQNGGELLKAMLK